MTKNYGCSLIVGGITLVGVLSTVVTCSRLHRSEYRLQRLENKAPTNPLVEKLWLGLPQKQKAAVFVDGLEATVNEFADRCREKVGELYNKKSRECEEYGK